MPPFSLNCMGNNFPLTSHPFIEFNGFLTCQKSKISEHHQEYIIFEMSTSLELQVTLSKVSVFHLLEWVLELEEAFVQGY